MVRNIQWKRRTEVALRVQNINYDNLEGVLFFEDNLSLYRNHFTPF